MAFEASKKEWSELYSFLRLLSDGHVCAGTPSGEVCVERPWKVVVVQREEHDGTRRYLIDSENVRIVGEKMDKVVPRTCFASAADLILEALKQAQSDEVTSPDVVEEFIDDIAIYDF